MPVPGLNTRLKAVQEARVLQPVEKCLRLAACVAAKIFIFIDNDFAIAIIKLIYIYLHFMTVIYPYIYLLIFFFNCFGKPSRQGT